MAVLNLTRLLAAIVFLASLASAGGAQVRVAGESELKAAFLFNMAKFVEWPDSAFAATGSSFVIGVLGDADLAATLEAKLEGKNVQGRTIEVRQFGSPGSVGPCQMLFVSPGRTGSARGLLSGLPVLIVGQHDRMLASGGVINFVVEDDTLRFEIKLGNAQERGLKISSKLLRLAKIVR